MIPGSKLAELRTGECTPLVFPNHCSYLICNLTSLPKPTPKLSSSAYPRYSVIPETITTQRSVSSHVVGSPGLVWNFFNQSNQECLVYLLCPVAHALRAFYCTFSTFDVNFASLKIKAGVWGKSMRGAYVRKRQYLINAGIVKVSF